MSLSPPLSLPYYCFSCAGGSAGGCHNAHVPDFSNGELMKFQRRLENGYDLLLDERYNLWLETYHPDRAKELGLVTVGALCVFTWCTIV